MPEKPSIVIWMPAPNRHLDPLLDAMLASGLLEHVYHARESLNWVQLGSGTAHRPNTLQTLVEPGFRLHRRVADAVTRHANSIHVIIGFADPICRLAMRECDRQSRRFFIWGESLRKRSPFDPRYIIRQVVYRTLVRRSAGALALSPAAAKDFHAMGIRKENVFPALYPGPVIRRTYKRPRQQRILYCGRLLAIKGFSELCSAVSKVSAKRAGLCFDVLGEGAESHHADKLAGTGVVVTMHGAVSSEKVLEVMAAAAVVVLPTLTRDGWGYVVNEAISCSVPIVASSAVAARELIAPGRTGFVFAAGNVDGLAGAIGSGLDLHECSGTITDDFLTTQKGIEPQAFVEYLQAVLFSSGLPKQANPTPPWHVAVEDLGGNAETEWWKRWQGLSECSNLGTQV